MVQGAAGDALQAALDGEGAEAEGPPAGLESDGSGDEAAEQVLLRFGTQPEGRCCVLLEQTRGWWQLLLHCMCQQISD